MQILHFSLISFLFLNACKSRNYSQSNIQHTIEAPDNSSIIEMEIFSREEAINELNSQDNPKALLAEH